MSNVFATDVHKQAYEEGVQDELRDSIPMKEVSTMQKKNVEYIHSRVGDDDSAEDSTDGTYEPDDAEYSDDKHLIDKEATKSHRIRFKEIQREGFDIVTDLSSRHGFALAESVHRHAARTIYKRAYGVLDNEVLGGSASALTPIALSETNPDNVAASITQVLQESGAYGNGVPFIMMSPKQGKKFNLFAMGAGFEVADNALRNGLFRVSKAGILGLYTIITNEVPRSVKSTAAGTIIADDTYAITVYDRVTFAPTTVTFTYKASPAVAGEVDLGISDEVSLANLAEAINAATGQGTKAGAGTKYIAHSTANRRVLRNAGITAEVTATTITTVGMRNFTVTEGMTGVTTAAAIENVLAGMRGAPVIALPTKGIRSDEKSVTGFNGIELTDTQIHDAWVFEKERGKIVRVLLNA